MTLAARAILVLDDDVLLTETYREALEDYGADVVYIAADNAEAFAILDRFAVDSAIVDLRLRDDLSTATTDRLTEQRIPFILATGSGQHDATPPPAEATLLSKPVAPEALVAALNAAVREI